MKQMKHVGLIHTVKTIVNKFEVLLREAVGEEIKVSNILDDYLANHTNEIGYFTVENKNRLLRHIRSMNEAGVDLIASTCSTLTPVIEEIKPFSKVPLLSIDDLMCRSAVEEGEKILILASALSTKLPLEERLHREAKKIQKAVKIDFRQDQQAFIAMKNLDMEVHDTFIMEMVKEKEAYDCIVLAQASMAHLEQKIQEKAGIPVFSGVSSCIKNIKQELEKEERKDVVKNQIGV